MAKFNLTLELLLPDGQTPSSKDVYDLLEATLQQASENPDVILARLVLSTDPSAEWVIRSEKYPNTIFSAEHGWIVCRNGEISSSDLHGPEAGLSIPIKEGSAWCRKDLVSGQMVLADLHSDDRVVDLKVDIRPFLETATADEIEELHSEDWSYAESADRVAYALEGMGDPGARKLFWYLGMNPGGSGNDQVGFGLSADGEAALRWLETYRPDFFNSLSFMDETPEP